MVLEALALDAHRETDQATQLLGEALALAEPGGFIRLFVDEGPPMRLLLADFRSRIEKQPPRQWDHAEQLRGQIAGRFRTTRKATASICNPHSTIRTHP